MNNKPTGWLNILGDTANAAETGTQLIARPNAVEDADGIDEDTIRYQWLRDGEAIDGATGARYCVTEEDRGTSINLLMTFTDLRGNPETVLNVDPVKIPTQDGYWERLYLEHIGEIDPEGLAWWKATGERMFLAGIK